MSEKLIECVPNFSEARRPEVIKQITDVIESVKGVKLLDVDPGPDMNRTVVTFVGTPEVVKEAAFLSIKKASEVIDMSVHTGSHPRMGATDVCPFIPVNGVTEEECIEISKQVAERVGNELGIPVYLYEKSASRPDRQNLAIVRAGEYEALPEKLSKPEWKPDFGPAEFNAKAGATAIGVREFLIAYNITLNTREPKFATDIAFEIRKKGKSVRRGNTDPIYLWGEELVKYKEGEYPCGHLDFVGKTMQETIDHTQEVHGYDIAALLKDHGTNPDNPIGRSVKIPGIFDCCKSIGWMVDEYDRAQISINLTNYKVTSMHDVLEKSRELAVKRGIVVTGSEIVGLVPFQALYESGIFYLKKQGRCTGIPVKDVLNTAIQSLGLEDVSPFNVEERVLGLPKNIDSALVEMKLKDFVDEVSRESPAPGGGSIAALAGALGAALSSMVSNLTAFQRGSQDVDGVLSDSANKCQEIIRKLVKGIDDDTDAFNSYMDARRLPNKTDEDKNVRNEAMLDGLKEAVSVPLETAKLSLEAIKISFDVAQYGNPNSITDVGVGAQMAFAGVMGGIYNVLINLKNINDDDYVEDMRKECDELEKTAKIDLKRVADFVENKLS